MSQKTCLSCGTSFYSEYFTYTCNVCKQTESMEKQHRLNREQAQEINEANARRAAEHAHALAQAEYYKIAAIQEQTRAIKESVITPKEAYQRGYDYLDHEWFFGNPANLSLSITERGNICTHRNGEVYIIPVLESNFDQGLQDRIDSYNVDALEVLKDSAYQAGKLNAEGTLRNRFYLTTGVTVEGVEIKTEIFDSNLHSTIDEDTGEISFEWNHPFYTDELNSQYEKGVNDAAKKLNTPERKKHRLENDVIEIQAQREALRKQQEQDEIDNNKDTNFAIACIALLWICPFVGLYLVWELTTGWTTFFSFIVGIVASLFIVVSYNQWHDDNKLRFSYPILEKVYRTFLYLGPFVGGYFVWTVFSGWTSLVFFTIMLIAFCVGHILNGEDWIT